MDFKSVIVVCLIAAVRSATVPVPGPSAPAPVVTTVGTTAPTSSSGPPAVLRCRSCSRANSLDDCTKLAVCSATEECYMDELITEQLTIVYNGGCRARDVCQSASSSVHIGKRDELVACSRCCGTKSDCNQRLCGITSSNINSQQCYSCDHRNSEQSQVLKPEDCVTLTTCQSDEMCYVSQGNTGGTNQFYYGCQKKQFCVILMKAVFADLKACSGPSPDPSICGGSKREIVKAMRNDVNLCHSCCGDGGCNFGECQDLNLRLYKLSESSLLDPVTLKSTNTTAGR